MSIKIADRRKKNSYPIFLDNDDEVELVKVRNSYEPPLSLPPTVDDLKKIIKQLEKAYKNEMQARVEAEENLKLIQLRNIGREKEFHKILEASDQRVRSYVRDSQASLTGKEIKSYYQGIVENFELTNQATAYMIESKYKESMLAMETRVEKIIYEFNEELSKNRVISSSNISEIRREIEQALGLVKTIEKENVGLRDKLNEERLKCQILNEERNLMIEQLVSKKMGIAKILEENKKLKQIIKELKKQQIDISDPSVDKISKMEVKQSNKNSALIRFKNILTNNLLKEPKTEAIDLRKVHLETANSYTSPLKADKNTKITRGTTSAQLGSRKKYSREVFIQNYYQSLDFSPNFISDKAEVKKNQARQSMKQRRKMLHSANTGCMGSFVKNSATKTESGFDEQRTENTIEHLKKCLEREKQKVSQLRKIVKTIKHNNEEVNETLLSIMKTAKQPNLNETSLTKFLRCEQLMKLITDMKKRLAMCEDPALNCGWGDLDIEDLIKEAYKIQK